MGDVARKDIPVNQDLDTLRHFTLKTHKGNKEGANPGKTVNGGGTCVLQGFQSPLSPGTSAGQAWCPSMSSCPFPQLEQGE